MIISGITGDSILDGLGLRVTLFVQGCPHHCKGCHNPDTWDFLGGAEKSIREIYDIILGHITSLHQGVTFSGGEPFHQSYELCELARLLKSDGLDIVVYTGYTLQSINDNPLLNYADYVIDGKFEIDKRDIGLKWRGSSNQVIWKKVDGLFLAQ